MCVRIQGLADESEDEWDAEEASQKRLSTEEEASQADSERTEKISAYYPGTVSTNGSQVSWLRTSRSLLQRPAHQSISGRCMSFMPVTASMLP
jgi:hypothetical protein